jgi:protein AaeX
MREISIGGVLVSPLLPCFFMTVPLFWAVDKVLRRFGCYRFVWHANLVRVALFIITYTILFGLQYE